MGLGKKILPFAVSAIVVGGVSVGVGYLAKGNVLSNRAAELDKDRAVMEQAWDLAFGDDGYTPRELMDFVNKIQVDRLSESERGLQSRIEAALGSDYVDTRNLFASDNPAGDIVMPEGKIGYGFDDPGKMYVLNVETQERICETNRETLEQYIQNHAQE